MDEKFCLKWNDFQQDAMRTFFFMSYQYNAMHKNFTRMEYQEPGPEIYIISSYSIVQGTQNFRLKGMQFGGFFLPMSCSCTIYPLVSMVFLQGIVFNILENTMSIRTTWRKVKMDDLTSMQEKPAIIWRMQLRFVFNFTCILTSLPNHYVNFNNSKF